MALGGRQPPLPPELSAGPDTRVRIGTPTPDSTIGITERGGRIDPHDSAAAGGRDDPRGPR